MVNCEHMTVRYERMPESYIHYGKVICDACGKFMGWQPNPANVEKRKEIERKIEVLRESKLTDWEEQFWTSVSKLEGKLSPKQTEILNKIYDSKKNPR